MASPLSNLCSELAELQARVAALDNFGLQKDAEEVFLPLDLRVCVDLRVQSLHLLPYFLDWADTIGYKA
jgi:hypothetical protein